MPTRVVDVGSPADFPLGSITPVDVDGSPLLLVHVAAGLFAIDASCTHEEFDLAGAMLEDCSIVCPMHLSRFDLASGAVLDPPAERPLATYPVSIVGDRVTIGPDRREQMP